MIKFELKEKKYEIELDEEGAGRFDKGYAIEFAGHLRCFLLKEIIVNDTFKNENLYIDKVPPKLQSFKDTQKRKIGQVHPTPYRYKEYFLATDYDREAYVKKQIGRFPSRKKYLDSIEKHKGIPPENPTELPDFFYHCANCVIDLKGKPVDQIKQLQDTGLIGPNHNSPSKRNRFYLSSSLGIALSHGGINQIEKVEKEKFFELGFQKAYQVMLLKIDKKKLAEYRDIYIDPESLDWDEEYRKTFIVEDGLPAVAISIIEIYDQIDLKI